MFVLIVVMEGAFSPQSWLLGLYFPTKSELKLVQYVNTSTVYFFESVHTKHTFLLP